MVHAPKFLGGSSGECHSALEIVTVFIFIIVLA
ncbi:hypothetical protein VTO73DRAFT_15595 [Trametes versicolor]